MTNVTSTCVAALLSAAVMLGGCKDDSSAKPGGGGPGRSSATTPPVAPTSAKAADLHPNRTALGQTTSRGLTVKAMQDDPIQPGGVGAFDVVVTDYPAGFKPKAVRAWVGTESGEGSAKAKADEEAPDHWHAHVEVPSPLPAGAKLWAEIEPGVGERFRVSFDVKR